MSTFPQHQGHEPRFCLNVNFARAPELDTYSGHQSFIKIQRGHSEASLIPSALIAKSASDSGRQGESYILQMRVSPRPLRKYKRVVDAWAMILPPIGFFGSALNIALAPST